MKRNHEICQTSIKKKITNFKGNNLDCRKKLQFCQMIEQNKLQILSNDHEENLMFLQSVVGKNCKFH